ncbi:hypothetical protein [Paraflavitalea speifideaquila]|uniref:hypothetical protein n=1 Tax=Paraflavitalea speifideaquila TaxID=3076558 RepID=UPI0028E7CC0E|nr:hypothetical protein [Paraflavitalea speifideiaquila]
MILAASCSVRNYNSSKPFPYRTTISIEGKTPEYDRLDLQTKLENQVDDSLKTRLIASLLVLKTLKNPPVFDSLNIGRSKIYLTTLLHSMGYFNPVIRDTFYIKTKQNKRRGEQKRVFTDFSITPGVAMRLDSIGYAMETPELQELALKSQKESLLKRERPIRISM